MARPTKGKDPLDVRITIRVSRNAFEKLQDAALAAGLSVAETARRRIEGVKIPDRGSITLANEMRQLRKELARQGGLIKHLYNEKQFEPELTREALNSQTANYRKVNEVLELVREKLEK